jgi:hypothetical protein
VRVLAKFMLPQLSSINNVSNLLTIRNPIVFLRFLLSCVMCQILAFRTTILYLVVKSTRPTLTLLIPLTLALAGLFQGMKKGSPRIATDSPGA